MGMESLTLVANPGSASRKYALYRGHTLLAHIHFEHEDGKIVLTLDAGEKSFHGQASFGDIRQSSHHIVDTLYEHHVIDAAEKLDRVAVRIVAPGKYFLEDHRIDASFRNHLQQAEAHAPLHVKAAFEEVVSLHEQFKHLPVYGISDSAFHISKPDVAWNYAINIKDADHLDIKRFGYHGLSVGSAVQSLHAVGKLPPRLVVCHLGSGASVTAVYHGKSYDTTMGYSPLEGLMMATRSGSIDIAAAQVLQKKLALSDDALELYLNKQSGLLGLSGVSSDIRELVKHEELGNYNASLALRTYVHNVQKAIGQMAAVMGGIDMLVFTGTVGERSFIMRSRIVEKLRFLDFLLDTKVNNQTNGPHEVTCINRLAQSRPIFVVPANEEREMLRRLEEIA